MTKAQSRSDNESLNVNRDLTLNLLESARHSLPKCSSTSIAANHPAQAGIDRELCLWSSGGDCSVTAATLSSEQQNPSSLADARFRISVVYAKQVLLRNLPWKVSGIVVAPAVDER